MSFMDQDESWSLFKSAAFSRDALPYEFETVGKQIADECHGLPLTIVVVAGLLNSKRAIEIPAKGFLKLENDLEGEAEKCLQELVERCLVLIRKKSLDGTKIRSCKTFIVQGPSRSDLVTFPEEIWGLMQLRNLKLPEFYLPNPPSISADKGSHMGFSNIQTISYLSPRCCTKEVIMGIQNVKELGISACEFDSNRLLNNLVHLQQLETLSLTCFSRFLPASAKAFPATLKKLKLERTWLSWSYLDIIAELPNLEVLKLVFNACDSEEWHPNVNGFTRLKIQELQSLRHTRVGGFPAESMADSISPMEYQIDRGVSGLHGLGYSSRPRPCLRS
ncbi:hypothetical protein BC332_24603 [Capsicum chinense]|nr:hypothetical protein BC332_24603 [Capsicum chinense]